MENRFLFAEWKEDQREEFRKLLEAGIWKELHARGCITDCRLDQLLKEEKKQLFEPGEGDGA